MDNNKKNEKGKAISRPETTFSPPGWDSPLYQTSTASTLTGIGTDMKKQENINNNNHVCKIKDTNQLNKKKAQLPSHKPDAIKGTWLTNRIVVNDYILLESLGRGSYGEVKLCKERHSGKLYAMKILKKGPCNSVVDAKKKVLDRHFRTGNEDVKREVAIMKKLRHDNVIRLYEVIDDPRSSTLYLVLEYMVSYQIWRHMTFV